MNHKEFIKNFKLFKNTKLSFGSMFVDPIDNPTWNQVSEIMKLDVVFFIDIEIPCNNGSSFKSSYIYNKNFQIYNNLYSIKYKIITYDVFKKFNITNDVIINKIYNCASIKILKDKDKIFDMVSSNLNMYNFSFFNEHITFSKVNKNEKNDIINNLLNLKCSLSFTMMDYDDNYIHLVTCRYNENGERYFNILVDESEINLNNFEKEKLNVYKLLSNI